MPKAGLNLAPLNKARVHVVVTSNNALNVSPENMGNNFVSLAFNGNITEFIQMAASQIQSPNLYIPVSISIDAAKTSGAYSAWRAALEKNSNIGEIRLIGDTSSLPDYTLSNCAIVGLDGLTFNGTAASSGIMVTGTYYINQDMFNL